LDTTRVALNRILCPVDFSEFSEHALRHAAALARWYGAELRLLHVFPVPPPVDIIPPLATPRAPASLTPADRTHIDEQLQRMAERVAPGMSIATTVQDAPSVYREILFQAERWPADLVVLGTHGYSGFERLVLGSVTEKILRLAPCPVFVVPNAVVESPVPGDVQFDRILAAVDFSESSLAALRYAMSIAEEADARLKVLNAIEVPPELQRRPTSADYDVEAVRAQAEAERLRCLSALIPEDVRTYCTIETAVVEGKASREILRHAAADDVDLILMGVQGRGPLDLMIFGSNAHDVIRQAPCPVLIVRAGTER
jgi:nucleotide-binding universal stress UspA family protein